MHWYSFKGFSQQSFQLIPDKMSSFDSFLGLFLSMIHLARKSLMVVNWTYKLTLCTLIPRWFNSYNTFSAQNTAQKVDILTSIWLLPKSLHVMTLFESNNNYYRTPLRGYSLLKESLQGHSRNSSLKES